MTPTCAHCGKQIPATEMATEFMAGDRLRRLRRS